MSPETHATTETPLRYGQTKRLQQALLALLAVDDQITAFAALVFLTIAENPDTSPGQVAEDLSCPLPRLKNTLYMLERGRSDSDKAALGLIEILQNPAPGFRHYRMLRLSPKGRKLYAQLAGAIRD